MKRTAVLSLVWTVALAVPPAAAAETVEPEAATPGVATATFAGGCFWCMEAPFDALDGVISTTVGYTGGTAKNPSYKTVSSGKTGHAEAVAIRFDPARISYATLLEIFWRNIDPLTPNRQFCDGGSQYRSAIFYHDDAQRNEAEQSKRALDTSGRFDQPIVTEIVAAGVFYPAEDYHQDYYRKNPIRYRFYRTGCGRDRRLEALWGSEAGGGKVVAH